MKNWLSALLALVGIIISFKGGAQQITYSEYQKFDARAGDYSVVGKSGGRLYTYRSGSDGFFLDAWDDSMNRTAIVMLDFFPRRIYETKFIAYPDKIIVLYQSVEGGYVSQHAALLDGAGRLQGRPINIDSVKTGFFGPSRDYFASAVSDDKKKIAVYAPLAKGDDLSLRGVILNDDMQIQSRFSTSYKADNSISFGEPLVGTDGAFYMPLFTEVGSREYSDGLWLLSIPQGGTRVVKELPLRDHYVTSTFIRFDAAGSNINLVGFYSTKKSGNYEGLFTSSYDPATASFSPLKALQFDAGLITASGERTKRKAFNDYSIRQLITRNDGGFVLVAESYYTTTHSSYSPYGYYSTYYNPLGAGNTIREYHYDDIMALSYDGAGSRQWQSFIRKSQYSQEDGGRFSSYTMLNTGGSLGFLFNDFGSRVSRIQLATIEDNGQSNIHALSAETSDDPDWLPRAGKQVSGHELIVPCFRKRNICFAKVVF